MRVVGYIILGSLALAVARAAIVALALLCLASFLWGFCARPKAMLGFIALCIVAKVAATYPGTAFVCIAACVSAAWLSAPEKSISSSDS